MTPEEHAQKTKEQAIANNDAWQLRNQNHLIQKIDYLHQRNLIGVQKADHDYLTAESKRLQARIEIMEKYGIESAPSPYNAEAVALHEQASTLIQAIIDDLKSKETPVPAQLEQAPLWLAS